ncbi:MAG: hypothetical protein M3406_05920 [Chloroflexota bacterium]|nr:hypothetical protein [Chloroflexota bacterium]
MRTLPVSLLVLLAACGGTSPASLPPDAADPVLVTAEGGDSAGGQGISVGEAFGHQATDDLVSVAGALFVDADETVWLCEAIAESFPPQCGGERIEVRGIDLASIEGLEEANGIQWAEAVTLFGSVE